MRLKTSFLLTSSLLFLLSPLRGDLFQGFYYGVGVGPQSNRGEAEMNTALNFSASSNPQFASSTENTIEQLSPFGEIFGGFGFQRQALYFGGRLGVNFSSYNLKQTTTFALTDPIGAFSVAQKNSVKMEMWPAEFTFDFKPGFTFFDIGMIYGIIGGALNKETLKAKSDAAILDSKIPGVVMISNLHLKEDKTTVGLRLGGGLEFFLNSQLALELSYIYTLYPKISTSGIDNVVMGGVLVSSLAGEFTFKPSKQLFELSLSYYY